MSRLDDLTKGALVRGVLGDRAVKVVDVAWHGSSAITLTYIDELSGKAGQELLYREDEARLVVQAAGRAQTSGGSRPITVKSVTVAARASHRPCGRRASRQPAARETGPGCPGSPVASPAAGPAETARMARGCREP